MKGGLRALALVLAAAAATAGCAARRPAPASPPPTPAPAPAPAPADPTSLYERLATDRVEYATGIDLLASGDELEGESRIVAASARVRAGAEECGRTPGCDQGRFFAALEELLGLQGAALKAQAARVLELEAGAVAAEEAEAEEEREPGTSPFVAALPQLGETASLLGGSGLGELVALNDPIRAAIQDWLTWLRPMLMEAHENYRYLRARIAPLYEEAGLPEALLFAIMATETGVKVHSVSRAGAAGPLQFMPSTGRRYGLSRVGGFDQRLDPEAATRASVSYLKDQLAAFHNNLEKALAAYNGGETRMARLQHRFGNVPLWDPALYGSLPRETREYVPRVLAAAWLFLHPEQYGLEFPASDAVPARLVLREEISIDELTVCLGGVGNPEGWFRILRNLNPHLQPGERVAAGAELAVPADVISLYEERCLDGEILGRARELHEASRAAEPEYETYTVRRGDTLARIASRHGCISLRDLAALNGIAPPRYVIHTGQRLKLPRCP